MRYLWPVGMGALLLFAVACSDDDGPLKACSPACGECQQCDVSGTVPVCVDKCGVGTTCEAGACVPVTDATCDPVCGACQTCDVSGDTPACVDNCGADLECQDGKCVAPTAVECDPACGACQQCDTSGATPICVDNCGTGMECQDGKCVPPAAVVCNPACGDCQLCDTTGDTPTCVDNCGADTVCVSGACVQPADPCAGACASCQRCDTSHGVPFCVDNCMAGSTCDTAENVCRPVGTTGFDHSTVPALQGPFALDIDGLRAITAACLSCHPQAGQDMLGSAHWKWTGPTPNLDGHESDTTIGKKNLINNFCIAIPSNEKRCSHCHAGYGYNDSTFDFTVTTNMDCLVCHASADYKKAPKTGGLPDATVGMDSAKLTAAAQSVGSPTRAACGRCHFSAGGGDNVKKGDLGSAMASPAAAADVHMGSATEAFTCANCHAAAGHKLLGQGVHVPVSEGRMGCEDCHGMAPHTNAALNNHALDVACQTCHIPAFSRQQPTKMDWDWSTAGNVSRNGETVDVDGHTMPAYDAMKGDFVWQKNVRPTYGWYDGRVTRMAINDTYPAGKGTDTDRILLGGPTATKADDSAKIFPFKVMKGRQAVDTTQRKMIVPHLFGPGGFWATIPTTYDATTVVNNWTTALTDGAKAAGQIAATGEDYTGFETGARPWSWAYTELWMGINHEVAPKSSALGCSSCHFNATGWGWTALGYSCDPAATGNDPVACGSRHP